MTAENYSGTVELSYRNIKDNSTDSMIKTPEIKINKIDNSKTFNDDLWYVVNKIEEMGIAKRDVLMNLEYTSVNMSDSNLMTEILNRIIVFYKNQSIKGDSQTHLLPKVRFGKEFLKYVKEQANREVRKVLVARSGLQDLVMGHYEYVASPGLMCAYIRSEKSNRKETKACSYDPTIFNKVKDDEDLRKKLEARERQLVEKYGAG